jgi:hypothetical protein
MLAVAVTAVLGGNVAVLLQPAAADAPLAAPAPVPTTTTSTSTTAVPVAPTPAPDLHAAAVAAVEVGGGVRVRGGGRCAPDQLQLSFDHPGSGWVSGAFVSPLGPPPGPDTTQVNGIVLCAGSRHAYIGFMAALTNGAWDVELVPDVDLSHDHDDGPAKNKPDKAPVPKPAPSTKPIVGMLDGPDIEGYARYEGQSTCDPSPKPGTVALRNLLLARYPATGSGGISRGCDVGGRSEHKEGRAFDWSAHVDNPKQLAAVEDFLNSLFATDSYGHRHALARRMGVQRRQPPHRPRAQLAVQGRRAGPDQLLLRRGRARSARLDPRRWGRIGNATSAARRAPTATRSHVDDGSGSGRCAAPAPRRAARTAGRRAPAS